MYSMQLDKITEAISHFIGMLEISVEEARQQLTAAYSGDPYSPTTVNSLRLLDRIDEFDVSSTDTASKYRQEAVALLAGGYRP